MFTCPLCIHTPMKDILVMSEIEGKGEKINRRDGIRRRKGVGMKGVGIKGFGK